MSAYERQSKHSMRRMMVTWSHRLRSFSQIYTHFLFRSLNSCMYTFISTQQTLVSMCFFPLALLLMMMIMMMVLRLLLLKAVYANRCVYAVLRLAFSEISLNWMAMKIVTLDRRETSFYSHIQARQNAKQFYWFIPIFLFLPFYDNKMRLTTKIKAKTVQN